MSHIFTMTNHHFFLKFFTPWTPKICWRNLWKTLTTEYTTGPARAGCSSCPYSISIWGSFTSAILDRVVGSLKSFGWDKYRSFEVEGFASISAKIWGDNCPPAPGSDDPVGRSWGLLLAVSSLGSLSIDYSLQKTLTDLISRKTTATGLEICN